MADAGPASPQPDGAADAPASEEERFGPLSVRRRVKDDGRVLILYARADEPDREAD